MFELAKFTDGRVFGAASYAPQAGDVVWLQRHGGDLIVHEEGQKPTADGRVVRFQWPAGRFGLSGRRAWLAYEKEARRG